MNDEGVVVVQAAGRQPGCAVTGTASATASVGVGDGDGDGDGKRRCRCQGGQWRNDGGRRRGGRRDDAGALMKVFL